MIFDTHCHGYWHGLVHRQPELRDHMRAEGVARSVHIGTDVDKSLAALALARRWGADTWCTVGFHPTGCQNLRAGSAKGYVDELERIARNNPDKVVGIGETGFDYFHLTGGDRDLQKRTQREFFQAQAEVALRLDLPLIIHTRDAAADCLAVLRETGIKRCVIHCFSESLAFAQRLLEWSDEIYFSFSGILTYARATSVQETARALPLDRVLVETDAPFLVPQAVRRTARDNEPAFTRHVMDFLKTLRPEPAEIVEQAVWDNSNRFYRVSADGPGWGAR
ncbi:MAG: TatD family hydrolase [Acidobacteriota bacterium]|jgi:TatD DNase family protein|nr:TatD family hydrolase [Acidobacteriota bacterium]